MNVATNGCKSVLLCAALTIACAARAGDIVVIMAAGTPPLSKERVASVYVGRNRDLKPIDLPETAPARSLFYKMATDRDLSQIKAVWSRIAFTGLGQPPKQVLDDKAVKLAVATDKTAIGYIDRSELDATVAVVLELN
jgi:hypothetical protein